MLTIVFVHPPLSLKDLYGDLEKGGSELPPQGLCCLAAVTRREGYNTKIIDCKTEGLNLKDTIKKILFYKPDYVGISAYTISVHNAAEIAKGLKEINKDVFVIVGGGHMSMLPEETMKIYPQFDLGVIGEAEITIVKLLDALKNKKDLSKVKGIIFRRGQDLVKTKREEFIRDLDSLPIPAWDLLLPIDKYYIPAADSINRLPAAGLVTSRGCPGLCYFCNRSMFGNSVRSYSVDRIIKMIVYLIEHYGVKEIYIQDDTFTFDKERVIGFCNRLIEENLDLTWSCHARVDYVDEEMLYAMKNAGCWQISYGVESASQDILDSINKGVKVEQIWNALNSTRKVGIKIKGLFMLGNFGETKETIKQTLGFIKKAPMDDFHMTMFTPVPATVSWKIAEKYGVMDKDWKKLDMFTPSFVPNGLTKEQLIYYYKKAYRTFYLKPSTILYYSRKLTNMRQAKKLMESFLAFIKFNLKRSIS